MATTHSDGYEIFYQVDGDADGEPLVLVMGFGAQLTAWPEDFVSLLGAAGFCVVRLDNRDIGLSSKSQSAPPDAADLFARAVAGEDVSAEAPYSLSDMASDVIAVMDDLSLDRADVVGASMGGMIVQHLAIEHSERFRSVTSIMSTTGDPTVGEADPEVLGALLSPPPEDREAIIARNIELGRLLAGPLFDEEYTSRLAELSYERNFNPIGSAFQLAAIAASGDRSAGLGGVDLPFLVIHGRQDTLIGVSGGMATAEVVPGADLLVLSQMGHNLPPLYWQQTVDAISGVARRS